MEIPLIEEMRQLRRLEELDLISPQCNWARWPNPYEGEEARRIYGEILKECTKFENKYL